MSSPPTPDQEELSNPGARVPSQETNQTQSGPQPSAADAADADTRLPEFIWRPEEVRAWMGMGGGSSLCTLSPCYNSHPGHATALYQLHAYKQISE